MPRPDRMPCVDHMPRHAGFFKREMLVRAQGADEQWARLEHALPRIQSQAACE